MSLKRVLCVGVVLSLWLVVSAFAISDTPTFVYAKRIGDVTMGETRAHVLYDYGPADEAGTEPRPYRSVSYKLGVEKWLGITYKYGRVIHVESNFRRYRTADGIGVGTRIPYGKWWRGFKLIRVSSSNYYWRKRNGPVTTSLFMEGNRIWLIQIEKPKQMPALP